MEAIFTLLGDIGEAMFAQCKGIADHGDPDRANEAWRRLRSTMASTGIVAHPKRRWTEGSATFEVVAVSDAIARRHDTGPVPGTIAHHKGWIGSGAFHLVDGSA